MSTNLLTALLHIADNTTMRQLNALTSSTNRMNSMGESLESYIQKAFSNRLITQNLSNNDIDVSNYFSYIGNQNNPPDLMLRGGDAIEVKKITKINSSIALNSSYPKDKLLANSSMITAHCKAAEPWESKDLLYAIGVVADHHITSLWFIYGDCYAANADIYRRIRQTISQSLVSSGLELAETNELGGIKKVDPLGITNLRIRGMWHIENPNKVFDYLPNSKITTDENKLQINSLMTLEKYKNFPDNVRCDIEQSAYVKHLVQIQSPNNPAQLIDAVLLTFRG